MLALIIGLPAVDEFNRLASEEDELNTEIVDLQNRVANIDVMASRLTATKETFESQQRTVDAETALKLREKVVELIHVCKCRLLKVQLGDSSTKPFAAGDDPMNDMEITDDDRPFELVKTSLILSAEGSLVQLNELVEKLQELHPLALPSKMTMRRDGPRGALRLEVELTLMDLRQKSVES
jgi:hypothetical protein